MKDKKEYVIPEIEIVVLDNEDCILLSGDETGPEDKDDI